MYDLSRRSFVSLWSYGNPQGADGKELCDVLVVCDPHVIIFSVKEVELNARATMPPVRRGGRGEQSNKSYKQLYGAERWLRESGSTHVIRNDGTQGLPFPAPAGMHVHRIAVALGSKGEVQCVSKDFGKGYVHVLDEGALLTLLRELNTITDFTDYLIAKRKLLKTSAVKVQGEENLLALYLHNNRSFPDSPRRALVQAGEWEKLCEDPAYQAKQVADRDSVVWDNLIALFAECIEAETHVGLLRPPATVSEAEQALRFSARESRFGRRVVGKQFQDFFDQAAALKVEARAVCSPSGVVYSCSLLRDLK